MIKQRRLLKLERLRRAKVFKLKLFDTSQEKKALTEAELKLKMRDYDPFKQMLAFQNLKLLLAGDNDVQIDDLV